MIYRCYTSKQNISRMCTLLLSKQVYLRGAFGSEWMSQKYRTDIKCICVSFKNISDIKPIGWSICFDEYISEGKRKLRLGVYVRPKFRRLGVATNMCRRIISSLPHEEYNVDDSKGIKKFWNSLPVKTISVW